MSSVETIIKNSKSKLISVTEHNNISSTNLSKHVLNIIAQTELVVTRIKTSKILKNKKKQNEKVGNIKRGYSIPDDKIHIKKDTQEYKIISKIKSLRKKGFKLHKIARQINNHNFYVIEMENRLMLAKFKRFY